MNPVHTPVTQSAAESAHHETLDVSIGRAYRVVAPPE